MSDVNKVLAFFIGVFVIILIIGFLISKINKQGNIAFKNGILSRIFPASLKTKNEVSSQKKPTPEKKVSLIALKPKSPTSKPHGNETKYSTNETSTIKEMQEVQSIPSTGSPILPFVFVGLPSGLYILKRTKK